MKKRSARIYYVSFLIVILGFVLYLFVKTLPKAEQEKMIKSFTNPIPAREVSLVYQKSHWKTDLFNALEKTIQSVVPKSLQELNASKLKILNIN